LRILLFSFYSLTMKYALIDTALGAMGIGWSDTGVARFALPGSDRGATEQRIAADAVPGEPDPALVERIVAYGEGEHIEFDDVPLDLGGQPEFHLKVYADILRLRWGETTTYGDIARRLGDVTLSRAVGQALGRNPIPLIVPCHRVLAADGRTGGFSAPGGASAKMRMLALERAADPRGQFSLGF
jgi:methylated-DNA-[protein]-cysteine S-methyltransferase